MLISVIIRSIGRDVIFRAIKSLENQTFKDFEIIVVEDGSDILQDKIHTNLNIRYFSSSEKIGRSAAGNLGMAMANGKYLIFLDDDDEFLPNHLESLCNIVNETTIAASLVYEVGESERGKIKTPRYTLYGKYNKQDILYKNILPINAVLFPKSLFTNYGGFDTDLDALEDWVLWAKYLKHINLAYSNIGSAIYYVPFSLKKYFSRRKIIKIHYTKAAQRVKEIYGSQNAHQKSSKIHRLKDILIKINMLFKLVFYRAVGITNYIIKGF
ncbi:MAG: glycosyltransferase [Alphaproteobacteria bacterium]|nr:glycosyltransferase [Alphaproteobacteria bacterium]OJV14157.1 MAG: hypothetical protein BGO27_01505 [Alphaproteobacteria bacterium 33-17]